VAELEVQLGRAHRDREESARVLDAMRAERAGLMGKVLEAARIQGGETGLDFDLAGFIADLRAEAIAVRTPALERVATDGRGGVLPARAAPPALQTVAVHADVPRSGLFAPAGPGTAGGPTLPSVRPQAVSGSPLTPPRSPLTPVDPPGPGVSPARDRPSAPPESPAAGAASILAVTREAERLFEQGRLAVPPSPRLGEESLVGFSIRQL